MWSPPSRLDASCEEMVRYEERFKEAENAILEALDSVTKAMAIARGGRREHVQSLDRCRASLEDAVRRLREARPREIW